MNLLLYRTYEETGNITVKIIANKLNQDLTITYQPEYAED